LANFTFVVDTEKLTGMRLLGPVVNDWTFGLIGAVQTGRPYPVSTGSGSFSGSAFPALGSETNQRPNICTAGSTLPGCAGAPVGAIVATNVASNAGSNLLISQNGVAACNNPALLIPPGTAGAPAVLPPAAANCSALRTTFLAPAGASGSGPVDSYTGDPVDFQFINGNLGRNLGLTKGLTNFDISVMKAFRIPKRESMRVEVKMDVFNVLNHPNFIGNDVNNSISAIGLASPLLTKTKAGVTTYSTNPGFNCAAACVNPFSGLYLGANGAPLTLSVFRSGRPDKDLANPNFAGLGDPAATALGTSAGANRVIQLGLRVRF
jgi:hypothetical protein